MHHRHLTTEEWTPMAIESLLERGQLADWREFARALGRDERLARETLRVAEYIEDRAAAALARSLVFRRFPGLDTVSAERPARQDTFAPLTVPKLTPPHPQQ